MKNMTPKLPTYKNKLLIGISLFFFLVIKYLIITYHADIKDILHSDQFKYWKLSNLLLNQKYFDEDFGFLRMPLYPLFLFAIRSITDQIILIILFQSIVGFLNIYLIYKISLYFDKKISYLVICLSLFNVNIINASTFILTEAIHLTFFLYFLLFFIKYIFTENIILKKNLNNIIFSAIFLALATLTRPITIYYLAILPLIFFKNDFFFKKVFSIILFILIYTMAVSPWNFRNLNYFGEYKLSSSVADNLNGYYLPYILANDLDISLIDAKKKIYNDVDLKKIDSIDENKKKDFFFKKIKEVKFISIVKTWIEGGIKFMFTPAIVETFYNLNIDKTSYSNLKFHSFIKRAEFFIFKNENKMFSYLMIVSISFGLIVKLIMCNYFIRTIKKNTFINALLLSILLLNLVIVGPLGSARYRLVMEPILIIYAALAIKLLHKKIKIFNFY